MTTNPTMDDFFVDEKPMVLDATIEQDINQYIEDYAVEIEKNEARAYEQSLKIFLNC